MFWSQIQGYHNIPKIAGDPKFLACVCVCVIVVRVVRTAIVELQLNRRSFRGLTTEPPVAYIDIFWQLAHRTSHDPCQSGSAGSATRSHWFVTRASHAPVVQIDVCAPQTRFDPPFGVSARTFSRSARAYISMLHPGHHRHGMREHNGRQQLFEWLISLRLIDEAQGYTAALVRLGFDDLQSLREVSGKYAW